MAACGIAPEDDDGNAGSRRVEVKTPDITDHLLAIEGSGSSEELAKIYKDALDACEGNQALQAKVIQAKKARVERAKQEKEA